MKKRNNFLISTILILLAVVFTILVKVVDVESVGVTGTNIGFYTLNKFIFDKIGVNMMWYYITDWLGLIPIFIALVYALMGLVQLLKRRSLFKVDKDIMVLGLFYIIVIFIYIFFEKVIVNYRPILIDDLLEASYPSSHTLMTLCLCGSSIIFNKINFSSFFSKIINILSVFIIIVTVIGRLLSGVYWFTDIVGGILIASALLMCFYSVLEYLNE